jgi:sec-independent protein translocase protein TatC
LDRPLPLARHLEELRSRILKSAAFIFIISCILYKFVDCILPLLIKPAGKLVFIIPQEAFLTNIKIALWGGLFLSSPFVLYEIWKFVSLGLMPRERRYVLLFGPLSFVFFVLGTVFGYFIIVSVGMKFLLGFASDSITPMLSIGRYISFISGIIFAFGVVFELPVAVLFLTKTGFVTPEFLSKKRRHIIVLIFILAAFLTPPDIVTQCLMALPLLVLYEISIIFSRAVWRKKAV